MSASNCQVIGGCPRAGAQHKQVSSEERYKKGRPKSVPITPVLVILSQEGHRFESSVDYSEFEPSLGSITKSCIAIKGGQKERKLGAGGGRGREGKEVGSPRRPAERLNEMLLPVSW